MIPVKTPKILYPMKVDPLDVGTSWAVPELANRINQFAFKITRDHRSELYTRKFLARLAYGDLNVIALVVVEAENEYSEGEVVGHMIAEIVERGEEKVAFIDQLELEHELGERKYEAVDKLLEIVDTWARCLDSKTKRVEVFDTERLEVYKRLYGQYGFKVTSLVLEGEVGSGRNKKQVQAGSQGYTRPPSTESGESTKPSSRSRKEKSRDIRRPKRRGRS